MGLQQLLTQLVRFGAGDQHVLAGHGVASRGLEGLLGGLGRKQQESPERRVKSGGPEGFWLQALGSGLLTLGWLTHLVSDVPAGCLHRKSLRFKPLRPAIRVEITGCGGKQRFGKRRREPEAIPEREMGNRCKVYGMVSKAAKRWRRGRCSGGAALSAN